MEWKDSFSLEEARLYSQQLNEKDMSEDDRQIYLARANMIVKRERSKPVVEELDSD
jgi:hypothetical protein